MADDARPLELKALAQQAKAEISITAPVLRYEKHGDGGLKLWCGNGCGVRTWEPKKAKPKTSTRKKAVKKDE
jgi:hypothetical protein